MDDTGWDRRRVAARDRERGDALARWLDHEVRPFSRWWRERLEGVQIRRLEDLAGVAVLTEAEAAAAGGPGNPSLLLLPTEEQFKRHAERGDLLRAARELRGGGAAARRAAIFRRYKPVHVHEAGVVNLLTMAYTRSDLDRLHLAGARLVEVLGLGADDALVSAVPAGPSLRFWGLYHAALAARMTALHPRGAGQEPLGPVRRALAMLGASVLAVPVDEAVAVLEGLADEGTKVPELRTVLSVGPPPQTRLREEIAQSAERLADGEVRVQAVWAPECARALWGEPRPATADPTEASYGLHTYPDLEVIEVRDVDSGETAEEGKPGELLYTSLGWRGTATVRLATGSWTAGLVTSVPCPLTGRTVPRLAPAAVDGAWQPAVAGADGSRVRPDLRRAPAALRDAGGDEAGLRGWSLRPVDGRLVLGLDLPDGADPGLGALFAEAVAEAIGVVPQVRIGDAAAAARPRLGNAGVESA